MIDKEEYQEEQTRQRKERQRQKLLERGRFELERRRQERLARQQELERQEEQARLAREQERLARQQELERQEEQVRQQIQARQEEQASLERLARQRERVWERRRQEVEQVERLVMQGERALEQERERARKVRELNERERQEEQAPLERLARQQERAWEQEREREERLKRERLKQERLEQERLERERARKVRRNRRIIFSIIVTVVGLYAYKAYEEFTLTPEELLARERAQLAEEKREIEEKHARAVAEVQERVRQEQKRREREEREVKERRAQELKNARIQVEIAKVKAERAKLRNQSIPKEVTEQIAQANRQLEQLQSAPSVTVTRSTELTKAREELARLKREGVDYSKLSEPNMTSALPVQSRLPSTPNAPIDNQTKLILSALWLGACFFLQRIGEKYFKDKGYALLAVCAAGFLLAFFTANYFLLGGSVTGGLMGSVGERS